MTDILFLRLADVHSLLPVPNSPNMIKLTPIVRPLAWVFLPFLQGGSNMTRTDCGLFTHKSIPVIFELPCTCYKTKLNSVALVRERTIPTERPPPVGEVSAKFCG